MPGQLSFLAADFAPPAVGDLAGVLLGPGHLVRLGGTARLSVLVDASNEPWRVNALLTAYTERGVRGESVLADDSQPDGPAIHTVRTPFSNVLRPLADHWVRGAIKAVPPGFRLDGPMLRLWVTAAGRRDGHGFVLGLGPNDPGTWEPAGAALAAGGLPGTFLGPRGGGPAYRIVGRRRITRLAEFVAEPPRGTPEAAWPG